MTAKRMRIPYDWRNLPEARVKEYVEYLLKNYKNSKIYRLQCTPYDGQTNSGLVVTISDIYDVNDCYVQIEKILSPTYKLGGHATQGWVVYSGSDYGYAYDGYNINGLDVFINQRHALWPEQYPMENPLYKSVHNLYLGVRAKTLPTYTQQEKFQQQKADQLKARKAKQDLLEQMYNEGNISKRIFDMYTAKTK